MNMGDVDESRCDIPRSCVSRPAEQAAAASGTDYGRGGNVVHRCGPTRWDQSGLAHDERLPRCVCFGSAPRPPGGCAADWASPAWAHAVPMTFSYSDFSEHAWFAGHWRTCKLHKLHLKILSIMCILWLKDALSEVLRILMVSESFGCWIFFYEWELQQKKDFWFFWWNETNLVYNQISFTLTTN